MIKDTNSKNSMINAECDKTKEKKQPAVGGMEASRLSMSEVPSGRKTRGGILVIYARISDRECTKRMKKTARSRRHGGVKAKHVRGAKRAEAKGGIRVIHARISDRECQRL